MSELCDQDSHTSQVKERYEKLKLKYGYLWTKLQEDPIVKNEVNSLRKRYPLSNLNMNVSNPLKNSDCKPVSPINGGDNIALRQQNRETNSTDVNENTVETKNDFLSAIYSKQKVTVKVPSQGDRCDLEGCDCDGNCAEPILETTYEDENDNVNVLQDTDKVEGKGESAKPNGSSLMTSFREIRDRSCSSRNSDSDGDESHDSYSSEDQKSKQCSDNSKSSDSDSSGGSTVIKFDLSHLQINSPSKSDSNDGSFGSAKGLSEKSCKGTPKSLGIDLNKCTISSAHATNTDDQLHSINQSTVTPSGMTVHTNAINDPHCLSPLLDGNNDVYDEKETGESETDAKNTSDSKTSFEVNSVSNIENDSSVEVGTVSTIAKDLRLDFEAWGGVQNAEIIHDDNGIALASVSMNQNKSPGSYNKSIDENSSSEFTSSDGRDSDSGDIEFTLNETSFIQAGIHIEDEDEDESELSQCDRDNISAPLSENDSSSSDDSVDITFTLDRKSFISAGIDLESQDSSSDDSVATNDRNGGPVSKGPDPDDPRESHDRKKKGDKLRLSYDEERIAHGDTMSAASEIIAGKNVVGTDDALGDNANKRSDILHDKKQHHLEASTSLETLEQNKNVNGSISSDEAEWSETGSDSSEDTATDDVVEQNAVIIVDDSDEISFEDSSDDSSSYIEEDESTVSLDESDDNFQQKDKNANIAVERIQKPTKKVDHVNVPKSVAKDTRVSFAIDEQERNSRPAQTPERKNQKQKQKTSTGKPKQFDFKRNRDHITKLTFREFNNKVFKGALGAVEVKWSPRLTSTAGLTRLKRMGRDSNATRSALIELSTKLIDEEDRLRSTLLHEMCHAAAWLVDGIHKPPHGSCFKKWAALGMLKIKGMLVTTTHSYVTNTFKFAWACATEGCPVVIQRHSRSVDPNRHCCGKCKGKLVEIEVPGSSKDTSDNGYTPKKKRQASAFSLFVQTHSGDVRKKLQIQKGTEKVSQQEVMKECGRLWREEKRTT